LLLVLPGAFRTLYVVVVLAEVVSLIISNYSQLVHQAASWGVTVPVFH
jgi:hypothetical protein